MMIKIVVYIVDSDGTLAYYIRIYNKTTSDGGILAHYICACIILRDGGGQCLFTTQRQCLISAVWYHTAVLLLWDAVNDGRRCVCMRTCAAAVTGLGGTTFTAALMSYFVVRILVRAAAAVTVLGGTMYTAVRTLDDVRNIPHQSTRC